MIINELFYMLDLDQDGQLSRSELFEAAQKLGWDWHEAPLYAVLDLLTITKPITKRAFNAYLTQIIEDPYGPFGAVLYKSALFVSSSVTGTQPIGEAQPLEGAPNPRNQQQCQDDIVSLVATFAGSQTAQELYTVLNSLKDPKPEISAEDAAVLVIDPQRSFTRGAWMQSIGSQAEHEVKPIRLAFENCARFIHRNRDRVEMMFTRCPFPPESYHWDDSLRGLLDPAQLYFIKPGNSVLFPPMNGFREWVDSLLRKNIKILVICGCTLNSCVRVSSIETLNYFRERALQVMVDLSMSGARISNYLNTSTFSGRSPVEAALREMTQAGVKVVQSIKWN